VRFVAACAVLVRCVGCAPNLLSGPEFHRSKALVDGLVADVPLRLDGILARMLRCSSREIVEVARPNRRATSRIVHSCARRNAMRSRSSNERYRSEREFSARTVRARPPRWERQ
jgi:hypothetical protein